MPAYDKDEAAVDAAIAEFENEYQHEFDQSFYERQANAHIPSTRFNNRVARYNVKDEDIKDMLFEISLKDLCLLADYVIMTHLPDDYNNEAELDKIIDIAAKGTTRKYLTDKQKWCIASFCLYYLQNGKAVI